MRTRTYSSTDPVLASPAELDDDRVQDICLGLADGPGGRFRVLHRMRITLRDAVKMAGRTANLLAGANRETLLDPHCRPSAIRKSESQDGSCLWLDYDVSSVLDGRPRISSRPLRLVLLAWFKAPDLLPTAKNEVR